MEDTGGHIVTYLKINYVSANFEFDTGTKASWQNSDSRQLDYNNQLEKF